MKVRCKFTVIGKHEFPALRELGTGKFEPIVATKVSMTAVYDGQPDVKGNACQENRIFGDATPTAGLEMTIMNEEAAAGFKTGKPYYLEFTPAH